MEHGYIVVFITVPDGETGQKVAEELVKRNLAACVNLVSPLQSIYRWKGELHQDQEILLICKTRADLFESQLVPAVRSVHPYETPEVIALPILMGNREYLDWIDEVTA
jgi:periplasmic divalent cation tolerance protein